MTKTMTKKQRIINYFIANPSADIKRAAAKFEVATTTLYSLRKQARHQAQEPQVLEPVVEAPIVLESFYESSRANERQVGGDHYRNMGVEPWNVVDTWSADQRIGYYRGNALKYLMRMGNKDQSSTDVAKCQHYIQKLLEVLNEQSGRGNE